MDKFIIKYKSRIDGAEKETFHHTIVENDTSRGFMNVYSEHITTDKKQAKVFYTREEAEKVVGLFGDDKIHVGKVIKK